MFVYIPFLVDLYHYLGIYEYHSKPERHHQEEYRVKVQFNHLYESRTFPNIYRACLHCNTRFLWNKTVKFTLERSTAVPP